MKIRTMCFASTRKAMPLDDTLKAASLALSRHINEISNRKNIRYGDLLSNFVRLRIRNPEFFDMIIAFPTRPLDVSCLRFIQTRFLFFDETDLNSIVPFLSHSLFLQYRTRSSFDDGNGYGATILVIHAGHPNLSS